MLKLLMKTRRLKKMKNFEDLSEQEKEVFFMGLCEGATYSMLAVQADCLELNSSGQWAGSKNAIVNLYVKRAVEEAWVNNDIRGSVRGGSALYKKAYALFIPRVEKLKSDFLRSKEEERLKAEQELKNTNIQ